MAEGFSLFFLSFLILVKNNEQNPMPLLHIFYFHFSISRRINTGVGRFLALLIFCFVFDFFLVLKRNLLVLFTPCSDRTRYRERFSLSSTKMREGE